MSTTTTRSSPELYSWQREHAERLLRAVGQRGSALDGSDTGTGKTVIALEVCRSLGRIPFVVCPKAVIPSWVEWMEAFRPHDPTYFAYTYDKLRRGSTQFLKRKGKHRIRWNLNRDNVLLIFDEVHRCKGSKSLNSKMLAAAKDGGIPTLMLSATVSGNPVEMKSIGYHLGLHDYDKWWRWCLRHGCRRGRFGGLQFDNSPDVVRYLHNRIYPDYGSRIRIKDLPEGTFPDNLIAADGYSISDSGRLDDIYESMREELEALDQRASTYEETALTLQLQARQETELLKVPTLVELADDARSEGNSVCVFVNFTATLEAIAGRLSMRRKDDRISLVHGRQTDQERKDAINEFQNNEARVIVCMIQAGGVGLSLHDVHGGHPRVSIISPSFSAVELRQTLGRVHRAGSQSVAVQKIVFAADTIEMGVCRAVRRKLTHLDLLNDDELNPIL